MKQLYTFLIVLSIAGRLIGQVPVSFKYQAVLRNQRGDIRANTETIIGIDILQGNVTGNSVYFEAHNVTTDAYGLINIEIGKGTSYIGNLSAVDWSTGVYFIKIIVDGLEMGTSQLLSVPYALYAKSAGNGFSGSYTDLLNKPVLFNGTWASLTGKPAFAVLATTGNYNDIINKPVLFNGTWASLTGKPDFANVATSGNYSDLTNRPDLNNYATKNMNNENITGLADPVNNRDAVNKQYVDKTNSYMISKTGDTLSFGNGTKVIIPGISAANPGAISYINGNDAYWNEAISGFRAVKIAGGDKIYTYDKRNKQYVSGSNILIPDKVSVPNGSTVSKTDFPGFNGGNPDGLLYQWDSISNNIVTQPSIFDQTKLFVSPVSVSKMNYTKVMQYNSNLLFTNSTNSTIIIDGPDSTLAYPLNLPKSGTYNLWLGAEMVTGGNLKNSNYTFSGSNIEYFSQQQLDSSVNCSYCVAVYGNGWRLPTDIEIGHKTNTYLYSIPTIIDPGYQTGTNEEIWTSTRFHYPGYSFYKWYVLSKDGNWNNTDQWSKLNFKVRCVYAGRPGR